MINSKIQIGDGALTHTAEYGLVHQESDTRFGSDHSDYEMSKYPEEGKGHILPILTEKPFDYKVKFMVVPPTNESLASHPINLIRGTNRGAEGWSFKGKANGVDQQYNVAYEDESKRISGYDGDPIPGVVIVRESPEPSTTPNSGYEVLLRDIDPSVIQKGWRYTLSFKMWANVPPGIDFNICVCDVTGGNRLTEYAGVRNLKNGLNEVTVKFAAIADGEFGGAQKLYFGVPNDKLWKWYSFEIWDLKLSKGDYSSLPYTPSPYDVIPTVGELIDNFNSKLYEKSGDLKTMKKVAFIDAYKHCKIVGYPTPLAVCEDYYSHTNIAEGQHTTAELTIKVSDPSLCDWAIDRRPAPFVAPTSLNDDISLQSDDQPINENIEDE